MATTEMNYIEGGGSAAESATFTIAYGTPVTLNFSYPHSEFIAVKSTNTYQIKDFICSDGIKATNSTLMNWINSSSVGDDGGYAWSNGNKTLTLTMPRNYYGGTYTICAM